MLPQVTSNDYKELVQTIEIGDLSMGTNKETIDNLEDPAVLQLPYGAPECRFATPRVLTKGGSFRIYLSIVGPEPEKSQSALPLSGRKAKDDIEKVADMVKALKKEPLC